MQLVWSSCLKIIFLLVLVRFFRVHCCYSVCMCMWPLFLLSSSIFFFSSLSISRLFCILDKSARMFTRRKPFSCELNLLWAQKAVESSRMSCCSSTWSVSSADPVPWSQRCLANGGLALCPGWLHKALVSYFCEQKLLWAARASHLGHTGRKSHLLTEFYWVMMELSFMVSRWGLSGFRWWLALLAE